MFYIVGVEDFDCTMKQRKRKLSCLEFRRLKGDIQMVDNLTLSL